MICMSCNPSSILFAQLSPFSACPVIPLQFSLLKLSRVLPVLYPSSILFAQTSPCSACPVLLFDSLCSNLIMFCLSCTPLRFYLLKLNHVLPVLHPSLILFAQTSPCSPCPYLFRFRRSNLKGQCHEIF